MNIGNAPAQIYVTYQGAASDRFDRDVYVKHHLPLVMSLWEGYGLQSLRAFFPVDDTGGTVAVCECVFRDEAAMQAAFASPETPEVMADVATFTDLAPKRLRALPL